MQIAYDAARAEDQIIEEDGEKEWQRSLVWTDEGIRMQIIKTSTFEFVFHTKAPDSIVYDKHIRKRIGTYHHCLVELRTTIEQQAQYGERLPRIWQYHLSILRRKCVEWAAELDEAEFQAFWLGL